MAELYTLNGGILWHINYISVKLFKKRNKKTEEYNEIKSKAISNIEA